MRARSLKIIAALGLAAGLSGCNPLAYPDCYRVQCPYPPVYQDSYAGYVPAYTDGRPAFGEPPWDDPFADLHAAHHCHQPERRQRPGRKRGPADGDALAALFQQHQHPRQRPADGGSGPTFRERRGVRPSGRPCPRRSTERQQCSDQAAAAEAAAPGGGGY